MKRFLLALVAALLAMQISATPAAAAPAHASLHAAHSTALADHAVIDNVSRTAFVGSGMNVGLGVTSIVASHLPQGTDAKRRLDGLMHFSTAATALYSASTAPHWIFQAAYVASAAYFAGMGVKTLWPGLAATLTDRVATSRIGKTLTSSTRAKYLPEVRKLRARSVAARKQLQKLGGKVDLDAHYQAMSTIKELESSTAHTAVGNPFTARLHAKLAERKATELSAQLKALR